MHKLQQFKAQMPSNVVIVFPLFMSWRVSSGDFGVIN